jgi:hypothetical protein
MKIAAPSRLWRSSLTPLVLLALAACGSQGTAGSGFPPSSTSAWDSQRNLSAAPLKSAHLCEKLVKGEPNIKVKKNCSFVFHKTELNAEVCYDPSQPSQCNVPRAATVKLTEKRYKGKFTASDKTKSLPSEITKSPWFVTGLCGDKGKSPSEDPEDIIDFSPSTGHGPSSKFTIKDEGPRTKSRSGSSTCNIVFYDSTDKFVEFMVVMATP